MGIIFCFFFFLKEKHCIVYNILYCDFMCGTVATTYGSYTYNIFYFFLKIFHLFFLFIKFSTMIELHCHHFKLLVGQSATLPINGR